VWFSSQMAGTRLLAFLLALLLKHIVCTEMWIYGAHAQLADDRGLLLQIGFSTLPLRPSD